MNCLIQAWDSHERELRTWLRKQLGSTADAEDVLQDVFLKALRQDKKFCAINNTRAWLFQVARNALIDRLRLKHDPLELPDDVPQANDEPAPVDTLATCLPRALAELPAEDHDIISACDLQGMKQDDYARQHGLSLPGAKSRLQRARKRLKAHLEAHCQVRYDDVGKVCCFVPRETSA
jgi:RNA polymerase sigma-70 factor (ECF subfamily)